MPGESQQSAERAGAVLDEGGEAELESKGSSGLAQVGEAQGHLGAVLT
jgi:hypothetical protein